MYSEDQYVMLSALQHWIFCPRQCALIHLEQAWAENRLTMQGNLMHERVHDGADEKRGSTLLARGMPIRSVRLGLVGQADMVEFLTSDVGTRLPNHRGLWQPFPVEYKHGKPKKDNSDKVQLCAQALCLEEMLNVIISSGALFYGKQKRRLDVTFDDPLRNETEAVAKVVHEMVESGMTPSPESSAKCRQCSLLELCLPSQFDRQRRSSYLKRIFEAE